MNTNEEDKNLSRKERREKKRAEKQARREQEVKQERKSDVTQNVLTWGLVSLLGVGLILFVVGLIGKGGNITQPDAADITLADDEWVAGNEEAEVTLVEYGDFQCPACKSAHSSVVNPLLAEYDDSLTFAYRHFPLPIHGNARPAARAAEAAGLQGAFFEMHDLLFETQSEWADLNDPYSQFEEYAAELDLDATQFEEDYNSDEVKEAISEDQSSGNRHAVSATPTFFLNGERLSNMSLADIQAEIVAAIEETEKASSESESIDASEDSGGEQ